MLTIRNMQEQQRPWVTRNFGADRPAYWPLMGLVEEVGELAHSQLKLEQGIRGTKEEHLEAIKDAIADISIFFSDYCSAQGWQMDEVLGCQDFARLQYLAASVASTLMPMDVGDYRLVLRMSIHVGDISVAFEEGNAVAGKRGSQLLFSMLVLFCHRHGWDMQEIFEKTWAKVMKRDWVKNAKTGGEGPPPEKVTPVYEEYPFDQKGGTLDKAAGSDKTVAVRHDPGDEKNFMMVDVTEEYFREE